MRLQGPDGTLAVWGLDAANLNWNLTDVPAGLTNVAAISVGALHSVALRSDGTVVAWGCTNGGETDVPASASNVVAIAAGRGYTLALRQDQTVVGWGAGLPAIPTDLLATNLVAGPGHALALRTGVLTPLILEQPVSQGVLAGDAATYHVRVSSRRQPTYQWQKDGINISGATNETLEVSSVQSGNQGTNRVWVSNGAGSVCSAEATLELIQAPVIVWPTVPQTVQVESGGALTLSVSATSQGWQYSAPGCLWYLGTNPVERAFWGTNLALGGQSPLLDGQYWVVVTNLAGSATSAVWNVRVVVPGGVGVWGTNAMVAPEQLTNAIALAAGGNHALGLTENGTVLAWGNNGFDQTNVPTGLTNIIGVAAGTSHSLALKEDGSIVAWGRNDLDQTTFATNVTDAIAISAGGQQSLALKRDSTVVQWGLTFASVPSGLANVTAIASGSNFHLALLSNTTVVAWGATGFGQTNVPDNLSNVVAIAAGGAHALALRSDGTVTGWGSNDFGESDAPSDLTNAMAIAAGGRHSIVLKNDGTVVAWGDNTAGQTNLPTAWGAVKLIAAGADYTLTSHFSPLVQYQVDVTKDLLLICNTNSVDSSNVCAYYLQHRPMVGGANVLGIGCPPQFTISPSDFTNTIQLPLLNWLNANPTKRPQYMVLFLDVPSRINEVTNAWVYDGSTNNSVSVAINSMFTGFQPFVTHINMRDYDGSLEWTTSACTNYINKLASIGSNYSPGRLIISASAREYGNTNYYFDDTRIGYRAPAPWAGGEAQAGVLGANPTASVVYSNVVDWADNTNLVGHITNGVNVAGYLSWGDHSALKSDYAIDPTKLKWQGTSGWWIIETIESHNGLPYAGHGDFYMWFDHRGFGGTNYENTPVGAVTHVDEPWGSWNDPQRYFGLWEGGKNLAICAWNSRLTPYFQAVGDPFVTR